MPVVTYSLLRLGLFVLAGALLFPVMRGWLLVVVAAVVGWALSYVLLGRQRDAAAGWLEARAQRRAAEPRFGRGAQQDELDEDREAERLRREGPGTPA